MQKVLELLGRTSGDFFPPPKTSRVEAKQAKALEIRRNYNLAGGAQKKKAKVCFIFLDRKAEDEKKARTVRLCVAAAQ